MSNHERRHIHHIISAEPLPLFDADQTNHGLHLTQQLDDYPVREQVCFVSSVPFLIKLYECMPI